jgi:murein DD-endopeptidase MepM/ murein hydrolase activator NlpD
VNDNPWIFPGLTGNRWTRVDLDALARAEFPDTATSNPLNDPWTCDSWVRTVTARLGADHSWGGWLEDRSHLWRGHYLPPGGAIHLGIDLNVPAGTTVLTPLGGVVVHAAPCRALGGGWGGWFVLRADTPRDGAAYLLFAHLAHRGLPQRGQTFAERAPVGVVGMPDENGGWYPHLHLQALSEAAWEAVQHAPDTLLDGYGYASDSLRHLFPDPAPLIGLPQAHAAS